MTASISTMDEAMADDSEAGEDEFSMVLKPGHEHAAPDMYPRLGNISAGLMNTAVLRAEEPTRPEYVTVPLRRFRGTVDETDLKTSVAVSRWNQLWEAAQFRRRIFGEEDLPGPLYRVADRGDVNVVFVPRTASRYYEYAPLFHLLPRAALERHGLPLLRYGEWPFLTQLGDIEDAVPADFHSRLSRAWAGTVWRPSRPVRPARHRP
ncbi:hypothetical protein [Micromonospora sp. CP22]|uniref:hypothetical protein n=1 Tax=Micromonospora sp. CP22 TaxID=2580517 RepID=UPI0012BD77CA|nr:hypothetical protein [Micromonospora sp. CP22]MTK05357.1 hypothetical protein [Micromonospora sp. CP22]